jgi:hypothetical protein
LLGQQSSRSGQANAGQQNTNRFVHESLSFTISSVSTDSRYRSSALGRDDSRQGPSRRHVTRR